MPRDGSGVYQLPPGTEAVSESTILSSTYNAFIADLEEDLNTPRPIGSGGTGADSAASARVELGLDLVAALGGAYSAGGSATVATLTIAELWTAYATGQMLAVKMPSAATGAATLNVTVPDIGALGAKAIRHEGDRAIQAGAWPANAVLILRYDAAYNSAAGAWVLLNDGLSVHNMPDAGHLSGFRNQIINGDFDIWQRSISASPGVGYFTADRVRCGGVFSGSTVTASRQSHTLGQTDVPGNPRYFYRCARTVTGSGQIAPWAHRIEGVQTLAGKKATLTMYLKGTSGKQLTMDMTQSFGTGGSPSSDVQSNIATPTLTTGWAKVQTVVDIPSIAGKTLGSGGNDYLEFQLKLPAAQGNTTVDISHVSLVEGDATAEADPFSPRHIGQEMALCQRYFADCSNNNSNSGPLGYGYGFSTTQVRLFVPTPVPLRSTPTLTCGSNNSVISNNTNVTPTSWAVDGVAGGNGGARMGHGVSLIVTLSSGGVASAPAIIRGAGSGDAFNFDAEI